jgi:hypothetical protein
MIWSDFLGTKFFLAAGVLAFVSWLICNGLIGSEQLRQDQEEAAARKYVLRAIPYVTDSWDISALEERSAGEMKASSVWQTYPTKFKIYKQKLGPALAYGDIVGSIEFDEVYGSEIIIGIYNQRVRFKRGVGEIAVRIVKREGGWKFQQFSVRSAILPAATDENDTGGNFSE